jgi:hypothetical protein
VAAVGGERSQDAIGRGGDAASIEAFGAHHPFCVEACGTIAGDAVAGDKIGKWG